MRMPFARLTGLTAALVVASGCAFAQSWPSKPTTIIVPFGAGSGVDILGRHIANELQEKLGKPFVVENKVGANGNVAAAQAAKAPADGSTLLMVSSQFSVLPAMYRDMPYDTRGDFVPLTQVATSPLVLAVPPTLHALVAARLDPGIHPGRGGHRPSPGNPTSLISGSSRVPVAASTRRCTSTTRA